MTIHSLGTLTSDGQTSTTYQVKRARNAEKGEFLVGATGTFDGGTATFQMSLDSGANYFSMGTEAEFTENGSNAVPVTGGDSSGTVRIRGDLSGSTSPSVQFFIVDNY